MADELVRGLPGSAYDPAQFNAACLRADLTTLLSNFDLAKANRVAEALLAEYVITPRRGKYGKRV